jgi:hypothetical protein
LVAAHLHPERASRRSSERIGVDGTWFTWIASLSDGRRPADHIAPDPDDDVADPYGRPAIQHVVMVHDIDTLTRRIAAAPPACRE